MPAVDGFKIVLAIGYKETTYGGDILDANMLDLVPVMDVNFFKPQIKYRTDEEELNNYLGATEAQQEDRMFSFTIKVQASAEVLTWALAQVTGNVATTGSSDPYTHTIKFPSICTLNGPSFAIMELISCSGATGTYKKYKGCCIDQLTLEMDGKNRPVLTITGKADGTETANPSFSVPAAALTRQKFIGANVALQLGAAGGGLTNYSSIYRTAKIVISAGLVIPPNVSNSLYVTEMQYGDKRPKIDFDFSLKCDKSHALYAAADAGTLYQTSLAINPGVTPLRSVTMTQANGYLDADPGRQGREPRMNFKFNELHNATDAGPATFVCKTAKAAYLANGS